MTNYRLKLQDNYSCLIISNKEQSGCASHFIGGVGIFILLIPILGMLFITKEITFASIMVLLLAMLISGYLMKLYLWNRYGQEFFIISKKSLETFNDYKLFKDNHRIYNFKKLKILIIIDGSGLYLDELNKDYVSSIENQLSVIGFKLDEKLITSHQELLISEIIKINKEISKV